MTNPFIFGKIVTGDHFIDRESEISSIMRTLLSGQNIICYSPRRYGKTSMMMRIKERLADKGTLVFFIDLFRVTSLQDLYTIYATSIVAAIQGPVKTLLSAVKTVLPTVNPKIVFSTPDTPTVEISAPIPLLSKSPTLLELFNSLEVYCQKKRKKGVVIFDEFQEISAIEEGDQIEREMRSAFQHHKQVSYAFIGSKQHLLKEIFKNRNRPFYNFGRHFELGVITQEYWRDYISGKMQTMCCPECIDNIIAITGGHPYYTQMYCHYLWEYAKDSKRRLDQEAFEIVSRDIVQRDSMLFSQLWDVISIKERHLLKAIASDMPQSLYEKRFLVLHNLGSASSVQKAAIKLFKLEYIRKSSSGIIDFVNPYFKLWVNNTEEIYL